MKLNWDDLLSDCVEFAQRLIQTPSMSREESEIAELVLHEMDKLGFSETAIDEIGNVSGKIPGSDRSLGALVLNCHLDHVDPGDLTLWSVPPYSGEIFSDRIFGRGACDIKGPTAVQIYSMAALLRSGTVPRRDVHFSGVVQEEIGGAGAVHWINHLDYPVELVLLGEPSSNDLSLGHRGIYQVWVKFSGRSVHASVPENSNPNYALGLFLERLSRNYSKLSTHPILGPTTVAPTVIEVDTTSPNVTPAWSKVLLDFRSSSESPDDIHQFINQLAKDLGPFGLPELFDLEIGDLPGSPQPLFGFYTPPDHPIVSRVQELITAGEGRKPELTSYRFATDGRFFEPKGITVLGYSPGEERLAHTAEESISIELMGNALRGYFSILRDF